MLLLYEEIQWEAPDSGIFGIAGLNAGDGVLHESLPGSGSRNILDITNLSNVEIPGVWIYRIDTANFTRPGTVY